MMGWKEERGGENFLKKKERKKERKRKRRGKKWEEDVNQRRFVRDANCSRGHHHRQEQHQTAWLTFQHSCHVEEASRPKAQNKNLCDTQGNVFYIVTQSHLIAVVLITSPELYIGRSDHGEVNVSSVIHIGALYHLYGPLSNLQPVSICHPPTFLISHLKDYSAFYTAS